MHYSIAVISTYTPRRCGIATFTENLCTYLERIDEFRGNVEIVVVDSEMQNYTGKKGVGFKISQNDLDSYEQAAKYINQKCFDIVILQHEYGLFGGPFGSYILSLLEDLRVPLITIMHSILKNPCAEQFEILRKIGQYSNRIVSMSKAGLSLLCEKYGLEVSRCVYIPHGVHNVPLAGSDSMKTALDWNDRRVLLSFGLLGPGKGIEYVLKALPEIIQSHPNVLYVIHGLTHPNILKQNGESYRQSLQQQIDSNHLENNVIFINKFSTTEDIYQILGAADICLTPYLAQEQIVSGTLSFAMSAGLPVISTPYWNAQEMLVEGRGVLVPFRDADAISVEVNRLLADDTRRRLIGKNAYQATRNMVWSNVTHEYVNLINYLQSTKVSVDYASH